LAQYLHRRAAEGAAGQPGRSAPKEVLFSSCDDEVRNLEDTPNLIRSSPLRPSLAMLSAMLADHQRGGLMTFVQSRMAGRISHGSCIQVRGDVRQPCISLYGPTHHGSSMSTHSPGIRKGHSQFHFILPHYAAWISCRRTASNRQRTWPARHGRDTRFGMACLTGWRSRGGAA
jgi:hypothetical protein